MGSLRRAVDLCSTQRFRLFRPVCAARSSLSAGSMERARLTPFPREQAATRMCMVSSFATELLEIRSKERSLHVLLIPGNPGIVAFYKDFVEALYENLGGQASVTAIGHISHSQKDAEHGRLFSLHEQIDHKVDLIEQELRHSEQPIVLVGHSIGAYIGLEIFKRLENKIKFLVGVYPFLKLNKNSVKQLAIGYIASEYTTMNDYLKTNRGVEEDAIYIFPFFQTRNAKWEDGSSLLCKGVSSFVSFIGSLQASITRGIVRRLLGPSWSVTAVDAACCHLLRYHTMRNVLFMAMTEFQKLTEEPDWTFIRAEEDKIAFLFGVDDHWGPLSLLEEISKRAPGVALLVETEGHTHGYCCTEAGSFWVADCMANLIKNQMLIRNN